MDTITKIAIRAPTHMRVNQRANNASHWRADGRVWLEGRRVDGVVQPITAAELAAWRSFTPDPGMWANHDEEEAGGAEWEARIRAAIEECAIPIVEDARDALSALSFAETRAGRAGPMGVVKAERYDNNGYPTRKVWVAMHSGWGAILQAEEVNTLLGGRTEWRVVSTGAPLAPVDDEQYDTARPSDEGWYWLTTP